MFYMLRKLSVLALIFILGSCVERMQPIHNAENVALPPIFETAAPSDIESAIERGAKDAGWRVKTIGLRELEATLNIRVHTAIVRIPFSQTNYSIIYKSSTNLPYTGIRIHKNYNIWIDKLQAKISGNLQLEASQIRATKSQISDDPAASWNAIRDSNNIAVLKEFLSKHQDSPYAPLAIKRLNKIGEDRELAASSPSVVPNTPSKEPVNFDVNGRWSVVADYTASPGMANPCISKLYWEFLVDFNSRPFSKVEWSKGEALYVSGRSDGNKAEMQINFPSGGNSWYWEEKFTLDKQIKSFKAAAKSTGGFYGNCIGTIEVRMVKLD